MLLCSSQYTIILKISAIRDATNTSSMQPFQISSINHLRSFQMELIGLSWVIYFSGRAVVILRYLSNHRAIYSHVILETAYSFPSSGKDPSSHFCNEQLYPHWQIGPKLAMMQAGSCGSLSWKCITRAKRR